jgi:hypothetical protein
VSSQSSTTGNPADTPVSPTVDNSPDARAGRINALIDQIQAEIEGYKPYDVKTARKVTIAARYAKELIVAG